MKLLFMMSDFYGVFVASDQVILVTRLMKPIVVLLSIWMVLYALVPLSYPRVLAVKAKVTMFAVMANILWVYLASTILSSWAVSFPSIVYTVCVGGIFFVWKFYVDQNIGVMMFLRRKIYE